ncbi:nucleoporin FG repeat-containing protein [Cyclospora cayetanensis]|uniref:Nucleoporin FG repeat-containing protein n=1 Tax=Cyclospora cayetanensis TaxID=88456 RepID=A0A1D3CU19_9EIME|nr:nucleoporin FG repeat-containing protein [Cyclospora cayetanensis]
MILRMAPWCCDADQVHKGPDSAAFVFPSRGLPLLQRAEGREGVSLYAVPPLHQKPFLVEIRLLPFFAHDVGGFLPSERILDSRDFSRQSPAVLLYPMIEVQGEDGCFVCTEEAARLILKQPNACSSLAVQQGQEEQGGIHGERRQFQRCGLLLLLSTRRMQQRLLPWSSRQQRRQLREQLRQTQETENGRFGIERARAGSTRDASPRNALQLRVYDICHFVGPRQRAEGRWRTSDARSTGRVLSPLERDELLDGEMKDVYGLGCLLSEVLTGEHPYIRPDKRTTWREAETMFFAAMLAGNAIPRKPFSYIQPSPTAVDLIWGMVEPNPHKRLRLAQVLNHPWMQQIPNSHTSKPSSL